MKRKYFLFILSFIFLFALSSCAWFLNIEREQRNGKGLPLSYSYSDSSYNKCVRYMNEIDNIIDKDNPTNNNKSIINEDIEYVINFLYNVASYRTIEYINYSTDNVKYSNSKALNKKYQAIVSEVYNWYALFLTNARNSSYKSFVFGDKTEEEIDDFIPHIESDDEKEIRLQLSNLESDYDDIMVQYENLSKDDTNYETKKSNLEQQVRELYVDYVKQNQLLAQEYNYNNYMDYGYYEEHDRDYTTSESDLFSTYVSEIIYDKLEEVTNRLDDKDELFKNDDFAAFFKGNHTLYKKYFKAFANKMSSKYNDTYKHLWNRGYFVFADSTSLNSKQGAFTTYLPGSEFDDPILYFGPKYQNIMSVVHEFGHYYFYYSCNGNALLSLDLAETHSQSNELLFLDYFYNESDYDKDVLNNIKNYKLKDCLSTILLCTVIDQFEQDVYEKDVNTLSSDQFDQIMYDVCDRMGGYENIKRLVGTDPQTYWKRVVVGSPSYYISYATSLVSSLELYSICTESFNSAKNKYEKLIHYDYEEELKYLDVLDYAGLSSPFEEETFVNYINIL